ncbi:hypothetical protein FE783_02845 [Paenibacillus mesophilus]|uniref:amidohydrolase family protein n=1 Tax=Paenibacillus mesophilus TaxID=2582849 RepID=UPI00110F5949|nr:amidohydrolase family protein [Paenibacillus mesophilus]TMV51899.1 hypothetical protein FE783_02845 [Paenibacillus mesophilus]
MNIDTHIHLYDPEAGDFSWPEPGSPIYRTVLPPDFTKQAAPHGITRSVVVACTTQPEQTKLILETMHDDPSIAAVIGFIEAGSPDFIEWYDRFCEYPKFRGFRFICTEKPNEQDFRNAAYVSGKRANVLEFLGSFEGIAKMSGLIEANPEVNFIIEHFARMQTDAKTMPPAFMQFLEDMSAYPNVYMKTSALLPLASADPAPTDVSCYMPVLEAAYRAFGEDRCLFGSDWPFLELKGEYGTSVRATESFLASKHEGVLEKVMRRNAERVYGL